MLRALYAVLEKTDEDAFSHGDGRHGKACQYLGLAGSLAIVRPSRFSEQQEPFFCPVSVAKNESTALRLVLCGYVKKGD